MNSRNVFPANDTRTRPGKKLALVALEHARSQGFKRCYLETTAFLKEAIGLYEHLGFEHIDAPTGLHGPRGLRSQDAEKSGCFVPAVFC